MKPGELYEYNWTKYRFVRSGKMMMPAGTWLSCVSLETEDKNEFYTISLGRFVAEFKRLKE